MPRSKSVLKRQRQDETRTMRNKSVRSALKTQEKNARAALGTDAADAQLRVTQKHLDQAAAKGVIHRNKAARKKSRLAKAAKTSG